MSENVLSAAAEALGVPEALVARSAEARASAQGTTADAILAAWAGDAPTPAAPAASPEPMAETTPVVEEVPAAATEATQPEEAEPESTSIEAGSRSEFLPPATQTVPQEPALASLPAPVLVGRTESLLNLVLGVLVLFAFGALITIVLPSAEAVATAEDGIPGSALVLSDRGEDGRTVYLQEGCWTCHTQAVRPIVTDAGLGAVSNAATIDQSGTPTFGIQRIGPDLTHVASREPTNTPAWLTGYLKDPTEFRLGSDHPSYTYLSEDRLDALVEYLMESK